MGATNQDVIRMIPRILLVGRFNIEEPVNWTRKKILLTQRPGLPQAVTRSNVAPEPIFFRYDPARLLSASRRSFSYYFCPFFWVIDRNSPSVQRVHSHFRF